MIGKSNYFTVSTADSLMISPGIRKMKIVITVTSMIVVTVEEIQLRIWRLFSDDRRMLFNNLIANA